jgi:hypothetical protein
MTKVMNWIGSSKFTNSQEMDFQRRFLEIDQPDTRIAYGSYVRLLTSELINQDIFKRKTRTLSSVLSFITISKTNILLTEWPDVLFL